MGDQPKLSWYLTSHPGQLNLDMPPWILAVVMATAEEETV